MDLAYGALASSTSTSGCPTANRSCGNCYNLNKNTSAIELWVKGPPPPGEGEVRDFHSTAPNGETSGRSVSKQPVDLNDPLSGYKQGGMNARSYDVTGIDTRLRYDSSRTPPFTVMTSMPSKS